MFPLRGGWETTLACFDFLGASSLWTRTQNLLPEFASKEENQLDIGQGFFSLYSVSSLLKFQTINCVDCILNNKYYLLRKAREAVSLITVILILLLSGMRDGDLEKLQIFKN